MQDASHDHESAYQFPELSQSSALDRGFECSVGLGIAFDNSSHSISAGSQPFGFGTNATNPINCGTLTAFDDNSMWGFAPSPKTLPVGQLMNPYADLWSGNERSLSLNNVGGLHDFGFPNLRVPDTPLQIENGHHMISDMSFDTNYLIGMGMASPGSFDAPLGYDSFMNPNMGLLLPAQHLDIPVAAPATAQGLSGPRIPCAYSGCTKAFKRDSDRVRHENTHRTVQGVNLCPIIGCPKSHGKGYSRPDKVTEHLWKKHANLGFTKA